MPRCRREDSLLGRRRVPPERCGIELANSEQEHDAVVEEVARLRRRPHALDDALCDVGGARGRQRLETPCCLERRFDGDAAHPEAELVVVVVGRVGAHRSDGGVKDCRSQRRRAVGGGGRRRVDEHSEPIALEIHIGTVQPQSVEDR